MLHLEYESISDESFNISHKFQSYILLFWNLFGLLKKYSEYILYIQLKQLNCLPNLNK